MNHACKDLKPDTLLLDRLTRVSAYCAVIVLLTGLIVLAGWQWDIGFLHRPILHLTAMNPLTALALLLAGSSLLLLSAPHLSGSAFHPSGRKRLAGYILAGIVLLIGLLRIAEALHMIHFRIDQVLFGAQLTSDGPGNLSNQMTISTASCFFLSGASLLLLNVEMARRRMPAHYLALVIAVMGLFSLVGYLYRVQAFYGAFTYIPMAVHTAACFLLIAISILFAHPGKGVVKEFTYAGSITARSLLPLVIILPVVLGYLRLLGYWNGLFSTEFGVTILVLSVIVTFTGIVWYNSCLLNKRDVLREETEQILLQSEERFRLLISSVKDYAIFMVDPAGYVTSWNDGAAYIKGYRAEEIIGRHISTFYTPEEIQEGEPAYNLARAREEGRFEKEGWRLRKDGTTFWANIVFTAVYDPRGEILGFSKVTRDITEKKRAEQQLRQFNEELEQQVQKKTAELTGIFERITEAFFAFDNNYCFTYLNKKAGELVRHDPASLIGKCVWDVFPDAVGSATFRDYHTAMTEQRNIVNTDYYAPLDLWQENYFYPSPNGLSIFVRDITEQVRTQKTITDYKYALDQSAIVAITDQKGIIKHVNENFCKISKYSPSELIGQDHRIINSGYHPAAFIKDLWFTIANGKIWRGELCNKAKDGSIYWVDTTIVPFLDEKGKPCEYLAIRTDSTQRKIDEERLQQSFQEIRQLASHLQDIREEERACIAREIHDELGQQLTGLKMDLSWISKKMTPQQDDQVRQKIGGTLELLDTTIKTVRRIATDLRPSILDDLGLVAAIEWQSQEFQKRSGIATGFLSTMTAFNGPSAIAIGLFRICQESLTNVARHAGASHVHITLQEKEDNIILLKIGDDGKGFEFRETGRRKTLGLLGMKERTLMMGGNFHIDSHPGKGTTLLVTVPLTPGKN